MGAETGYLEGANFYRHDCVLFFLFVDTICVSVKEPGNVCV